MQSLASIKKKFGSRLIVMIMEIEKELEGFEELRLKRPLLYLILKYDPNFVTIDNMICAENVFFINSVINWCTEKRDHGTMTYEQFKSHMLMLQKYLKKEVDLFWEDGILYMKEHK